MAAGDPLLEFAAVRRRLRAECPWNAAQTHRSLARYLLEEAHETLDAIDTGTDTGDWAHLREELGDLLLQVVLHAAIAEESGAFTLDEVAADATAKAVRRNPHVFGPDAQGGASGLTPEQVNAEWQRRKAQEKSSRSSVLDGIAPGLPALLLADKVLDRLGAPAERHTDPNVLVAKRMTDPGVDVGERLLALVAEARREGVDPEQALRDAVRRVVAAVEG